MASSQTKGTAMGVVAIISWGGLGALGAVSASMPPYFLLGCCFTIAAIVGSSYCLLARIPIRPRVNVEILVAAALLSSYQLVYFEAFHHADPLLVSLINYLWPAWLVVIGNIFFRMNSGAAGYLGAATGFLGVAALIGADFDPSASDLLGYSLAMSGAVIWATYSNSRRLARHKDIGSMVMICGLAALISFGAGVADNESFCPTPMQMLLILGLGLGPSGGAYFLWDYGMRVGNAPLLGVLGYSAPLISTGIMVMFGIGEASWRMGISVGLITLGGIIVHAGGRARQRLQHGVLRGADHVQETAD